MGGFARPTIDNVNVRWDDSAPRWAGAGEKEIESFPGARELAFLVGGGGGGALPGVTLMYGCRCVRSVAAASYGDARASSVAEPVEMWPRRVPPTSSHRKSGVAVGTREGEGSVSAAV
ncbi:hypothetical protein NL676_032561 [Syzygium grande]|nr:hypothetical protein NL676_032561 [Syzygium grande]